MNVGVNGLGDDEECKMLQRLKDDLQVVSGNPKIPVS